MNTILALEEKREETLEEGNDMDQKAPEKVPGDGKSKKTSGDRYPTTATKALKGWQFGLPFKTRTKHNF